VTVLPNKRSPHLQEAFVRRHAAAWSIGIGPPIWWCMPPTTGGPAINRAQFAGDRVATAVASYGAARAADHLMNIVALEIGDKGGR
jgi:hypothetical protein